MGEWGWLLVGASAVDKKRHAAAMRGCIQRRLPPAYRERAVRYMGMMLNRQTGGKEGRGCTWQTQKSSSNSQSIGSLSFDGFALLLLLRIVDS
jgi:hypothetical protein